MQVKIFINEKLYKTQTVTGESYNPGFVWPQIQADKEAGLLSTFIGADGKLSIRIEKSK